MKTLKRDKGTGPTLGEDNSVKASAGECKNFHGDGNVTLSTDTGAFSTIIGDNLSMH